MSAPTTSGPDRPAGPDDALEALLREPAGYLADDGFTAQVMTTLPPPARSTRWRPVILAAAALLAALVAGFALQGLWRPAEAAGLGAWLWRAFTWIPADLPVAMPLVPFALGALALAGALAWARAS